MKDSLVNEGIDMFGKNLSYYRHSHKMTQIELGQKADIHRTHISALEQGSTNPALGTVLKLADALDIEPWQLLYDRRNDTDSVE